MTSWYHGTVSGQIQQFRPFTHFGNLEAAHHACAIKYRRPNRGEVPTLASTTITEVEINLPDEAIYRAKKDWGSPNTPALANLIEWDFETFSEEVRARAQEIRKNILSHPKSEWTNLYDRVKVLYDELNIRAIHYTNTVENRDGSPSICVVDPSAITIVRHHSITEAEIDIAFSRSIFSRSVT